MPPKDDDDEEQQGFMDKVKAKAAEIQEQMGPMLESAKEKTAEFTEKVKEKYVELQAQMGPMVESAKERMGSTMEDIKVKVGPTTDAVKQWGSNVIIEWQQPYQGKIFHACF